jgi:D-beta-D-heptose 7-phosphate kinase/D-beta-D-heptose 1-phosphate adenosyltransferase
MRSLDSKIRSRTVLRADCEKFRKMGKKLVFTNGSFDILHAGHVEYLDFARKQGDLLIVGVNSDDSVRRYKGPKRPINPEQDRARVLAALESVDFVVLFDEDEPAVLIGELQPDVLVKGADWGHYISGRDVVEKRGGAVVLAQMVPEKSTSKVIERVLDAYGKRITKPGI